MMSLGLMSLCSRFLMAAPARRHSSSFNGSSAGVDDEYCITQHIIHRNT